VTGPPEKPLRIGVFGARGIPSTYSGYETFLTILLPELARRGHAVTMYCRRDEVPRLPAFEGVACRHLPAVRSKQFATLSHGWLAAAASAAARHDVLLVVNVANAPACLFARVLGRRIVLNTDGLEWTRSKWGAVAHGVFWACARMARVSTSGLIADSVAMRDVYQRRFDAPSTVIPYCWPGVEAPLPATRNRFSMEPRTYLVIAGRLVPENNIDRIAESYLQTDFPHALLVLGSANYRSPVVAALDRLAAQDQRLVLGGHVDDRAEFMSLLRDSLVYLHGHSVGGINPALIEAMGCGARIVALDTPFNREALGNTGDYFGMVQPSMASVVARVLDEADPENQSRREAAKVRARARFDLATVADAYEALLIAVARGSRWSHTTMSTAWGAAEQGE